MARIYKLNGAAYEYAHRECVMKYTPKAYSDDDLKYIKDCWDSWEGTEKDGYIEIDDINRLICDRLTPVEAKHMKDILVKEAEVIELPPGQKVPEYKNPYKESEYVSYTFEDMGMKDPRDLGKS